MGVVANSPSLARFDPGRFERRTFAEDGTVRVVYAGALTPTYEVDVVIEAIAALRAARPELRVGFDVYGRGDAAEPWAAAPASAASATRSRSTAGYRSRTSRR